LGTPWSKAFFACEAHLHRAQSSVEVLRFATTAFFEIRRRRTESTTGRLELGHQMDQGVTPEAIGFRQYVDGVRLKLRLPELNNDVLSHDGLLAGLRPRYFVDRLSKQLHPQINRFLVDCLSQPSFAIFIATAVVNHCPLSEAQAKLEGRRIEAARQVLDRMFELRELSDSEDVQETRLKTRLIELWAREEIASA